MDKSVWTTEYGVLLDVLRDLRRRAGVTQVELAARIGQSQSFVSKCERGESRLDMIQLRAFCDALGTTLPAFVKLFEQRLAKSGSGRR